jgi:hypothetical protein
MEMSLELKIFHRRKFTSVHSTIGGEEEDINNQG